MPLCGQIEMCTMKTGNYNGIDSGEPSVEDCEHVAFHNSLKPYKL